MFLIQVLYSLQTQFVIIISTIELLEQKANPIPFGYKNYQNKFQTSRCTGSAPSNPLFFDKIYKGFPKIYEGKIFPYEFQFLPLKLIIQTKSAWEYAILRSRRLFRHPYNRSQSTMASMATGNYIQAGFFPREPAIFARRKCVGQQY